MSKFHPERTFAAKAKEYACPGSNKKMLHSLKWRICEAFPSSLLSPLNTLSHYPTWVVPHGEAELFAMYEMYRSLGLWGDAIPRE